MCLLVRCNGPGCILLFLRDLGRAFQGRVNVGDPVVGDRGAGNLGFGDKGGRPALRCRIGVVVPLVSVALGECGGPFLPGCCCTTNLRSENGITEQIVQSTAVHAEKCAQMNRALIQPGMMHSDPARHAFICVNKRL